MRAWDIRGLVTAGVLVGCLACSAGAGAAQLAVGVGHGCLVLSSGHVECWGANESGQLGNGTLANSDVPVEVLGLTSVVAVSVAEGDSCALLSSGHVDCWGNANSGALGDGNQNANSDVPVEVHGVSDATQLAVGFQHACVVLSSGHVDCWGGEDIGHIVYERLTPVEVSGIDNATQVAAGRGDSCALLSSGHVECWEENEYGQLGVDPSKIGASETPVEVQGIATATQIAAGSGHSCALLSRGQVACWGDDKAGQLGDGTSGQSYVPVEVKGVTGAAQLTAGGEDSCVLTSNSRVDCWGENFYGQLGNGTIANSSTPGEVRGVTNATQIAAGGEDSCVLLSDGNVDCLGDNESGQLGDGANGGDWTTPIAVQGPTDYTHVAVAYSHSCAVQSDGHVDCWGENFDGELGDGTTERSEAPVEAHGVTDAVQVSVGEGDSCAVLSSGHVDCWGGDSFEAGQLGNGAYDSSTTPVEVKNLTNATQVATSTYGSCALLSSGHVDCWGNNGEGELGNGTRGGSSDTPVEVEGLTNATQVAAGEYDSCAALASGQLDCWGSNLLGELGNGTELASDAPTQVHGLAGVTSVGTAYEHSCAVLSSGHVECWGANYNGQLGDGTAAGPEHCNYESCAKTPVEVSGLAGAIEVAAGGSDSCALLSNGHADCWGSNLSGQLGNGTGASPEGCTYYACDKWDTPVEVQGLAHATQIAVGGDNDFAGAGSACAALSTRALDCWGSNHAGALGNGLAWSTSPVGLVGFSQAPGQNPTVPGDSTPPLIPPSQEASAKITNLTSARASSFASLASLSATASKNGKLALELTCNDGRSTCTGTVSIRLIYPPRHHKSKTVLLASARYTIRAASSAKLTLTLSSYARALLAKGDTLHTTATITTIGDAAPTKNTSRLAVHAAKH